MALRFADRMVIIDRVNRFGLLADVQEWPGLRAFLADELWIDFSDLDGVEGQHVATQNLIRSWKEQMAGFHSVQHTITNHCVDLLAPDRVECRAHAQIHHRLPNEHGSSSWILGGLYTFGFERKGTD